MTNEPPEIDIDEVETVLFGAPLTPEERERRPEPEKQPEPTERVEEEPVRDATEEDKKEFNIKANQLLRHGEPHFLFLGDYDWFRPMQKYLLEKYDFHLDTALTESDAQILAERPNKVRAAEAKVVQDTPNTDQRPATSREVGVGTLANPGDWLSVTISNMTKSPAYHAMSPIFMKVLDYMMEQLHSDLANDPKAKEVGIQMSLSHLRTRYGYKIADKTLTKALRFIVALGFFRIDPASTHGPKGRRYIYMNRWRHMSAEEAESKIKGVLEQYYRK